jgi:HK97 family phage major capsid protein
MNQFQRYQNEADSITRNPNGMNGQSRARLSFLLNAMATLREFGMQDPHATGTDEQRKASLRFREALLGESRTYSPMSLAGQPQIVPQDFSDQMAVLGLAAGPLYLGSPILTNIERTHNEPLKVPVSTDLSVGYTQSEAALITEQELNFAKVSLGANTFSTGILLLSNDLSDDISWTTAQGLLLRTASARLSRRMNQQFIPQLVTNLAANSSASISSIVAATISADDLSALVGSVNAQYRSSDSAGFLLNSDTARQIYNIKAQTGGERVYKHVLDAKPTLLGYPVFVSDYASNIATGNHPVIFGDWSYVYSRQIPGFEVQVLNERFKIDYDAAGIIIRQRGDMQFAVPSTSESPLKMLTVS